MKNVLWLLYKSDDVLLWLTWPKKRNGKRKVRPLHIQDWNPSADTQKSCNSDLHKPSALSDIKDRLSRKSTEAFLKLLWYLRGSTLMLTTVSISPLPYFFFSSPPDVALQMAQEFKPMKWLPPRIAYNSPTVRSSWFLSPRARSR